MIKNSGKPAKIFLPAVFPGVVIQKTVGYDQKTVFHTDFQAEKHSKKQKINQIVKKNISTFFTYHNAVSPDDRIEKIWRKHETFDFGFNSDGFFIPFKCFA